jgi:hypothetical protein
MGRWRYPIALKAAKNALPGTGGMARTANRPREEAERQIASSRRPTKGSNRRPPLLHTGAVVYRRCRDRPPETFNGAEKRAFMDGHQLTVPAAPAETAAVEAPTQAATAETSADAGVRKAKAAKAGVEETRVSKAGVDKAKAVEPWVKEGTSETTVPTAIECDGSPAGPAPRPAPAPSPGITSPIPIIRVGIPIGVRGRHLRFRRKGRRLGEHGRCD